MPATPADATPRVRFRLQQSADGRTCVDVVECPASRRLLVDKHAVVADPRAKDVAAAALHELDVLLSLQQLQDDASGQYQHLRDHVVRLEGYRLEGERLHVLQEFCARGDLQRTVEREARLVRAGLLNAEDGRTTSVRGVRTLFRQLLRGVAALHAAGVAHLDLSLENVLLTDAEVVKVADLGHAVRIANASQCVTAAKDAYAAPELLAPQTQQVDVTKCDSWALGVILYALCAKRALVSRADGSDAFFAEMCKIGARRALRRRFVREAESPAPCSLFAAPEQLPSGLFDLMSRLLDVDPNSRMSAATALQHPWLSNVITRRVSAASLPERATQPIFRRASSMSSSTTIPTNHGRQTTVSKTVSINSIQGRHTTTPKSSTITTQSRPTTVVRSSSFGTHQGRQTTTKRLPEPVGGNRMELKMESGSPERSSSRRTLRNEIVLDETRVAMLRPSAS